jgi:hypothetical protein
MRGLSGRHQAKISAMELHSPFDSRGRKKCVPFFQLARLHISSYFHSIAATYFHYSIHIPYIFHHISTIPYYSTTLCCWCHSGPKSVPSASAEFLATGKAAESLERDCCDDILHVRGPQGNIYKYNYIYIYVK